jgi:hypothetical protein
VPTVEEAIAAWLSARGFAPSTAAATHQHLESGRARGWRAQQGIVTIDQLSAEAGAEYLRYLRDRGAAPANKGYRPRAQARSNRPNAALAP